MNNHNFNNNVSNNLNYNNINMINNMNNNMMNYNMNNNLINNNIMNNTKNKMINNVMNYNMNKNMMNYNMNNNLINNNMKNNMMDNSMNKNIIDNNKIINKNNDDEQNNLIDFIFKEYEDYFPLIGLKKVGTPLNSILQCLLHIPELNGFFINKYLEHKDRLKKINDISETAGRLCEEYHKVVLDIFKHKDEIKYYVITKNFNNFLCNINGQLTKYGENDAKDLLLYLLQMMHEELNYFGDQKLKNIPKCNKLIEAESFNYFMTMNSNLNLSVISYLFYGILKSKTICKGCKKIIYDFQYFKILSFPTYNFKDSIFNINQGFKEFTKPKLMNDDNKYYCKYCKGFREAEVTTKIYYPPPYLIINIDYDKNKKYKPRKVNLEVELILKILQMNLINYLTFNIN